MTKEYTNQHRIDLNDYILASKMTQRILTTGVEASAESKPTILLSRGLGFNAQGKFKVNLDRPEGSKNKWQRYFAKGCPELLEYLARVDTLNGLDFHLENYFDKTVPRNKEVIMAPLQVSKEEPSPELLAWAVQLPDWGELYTPNGLNFYAVFHLYRMEFDKNPEYRQLLRICDAYDSPYRVRFCQGKPQNDAEVEGQHADDLTRLTGVASEEEELPKPVAAPTDVCADYLAELISEKNRREVEYLRVKVTTLIEDIKGIDENDIDLPTNVGDLRVLLNKLKIIRDLEEELDV